MDAREVAVVARALFRAAEDVVGFADGDEARGRTGLGGVEVGVVALGEGVELSVFEGLGGQLGRQAQITKCY